MRVTAFAMMIFIVLFIVLTVMSKLTDDVKLFMCQRDCDLLGRELSSYSGDRFVVCHCGNKKHIKTMKRP